MSDDYINEPALATVYDAVQQANASSCNDGAILAGYVMVCEWLMPDGTYALDYHSAGPTGGYMPTWRGRALLDEALRRVDRLTEALDSQESDDE